MTIKRILNKGRGKFMARYHSKEGWSTFSNRPFWWRQKLEENEDCREYRYYWNDTNEIISHFRKENGRRYIDVNGKMVEVVPNDIPGSGSFQDWK